MLNALIHCLTHCAFIFAGLFRPRLYKEDPLLYLVHFIDAGWIITHVVAFCLAAYYIPIMLVVFIPPILFGLWIIKKQEDLVSDSFAEAERLAEETKIEIKDIDGPQSNP